MPLSLDERGASVTSGVCEGGDEGPSARGCMNPLRLAARHPLQFPLGEGEGKGVADAKRGGHLPLIVSFSWATLVRAPFTLRKGLDSRVGGNDDSGRRVEGAGAWVYEPPASRCA